MRTNDHSTSFEQMAYDSEPSEWLIEMHDHYREKGFYRQQDMRRALGDPAKEIRMPDGHESATAFSHLIQ